MYRIAEEFKKRFPTKEAWLEGQEARGRTVR